MNTFIELTDMNKDTIVIDIMSINAIRRCKDEMGIQGEFTCVHMSNSSTKFAVKEHPHVIFKIIQGVLEQ